jgi:hypothetical protein
VVGRNNTLAAELISLIKRQDLYSPLELETVGSCPPAGVAMNLEFCSMLATGQQDDTIEAPLTTP